MVILDVPKNLSLINYQQIEVQMVVHMLFQHNLYVLLLIKAKHNALSGNFEDLFTKKGKNVDFMAILAIFGHYGPFLAILGGFGRSGASWAPRGGRRGGEKQPLVARSVLRA
jgi:hypothetical protein